MEELQSEVCLYFKVFGLGKDESGNPCYAGMKMSFGKSKNGVHYSEVQKKVQSIHDWKEQMLRLTHLDTVGFGPNDIELITPDEYDRDYGDDGQQEDDDDE